MGQISDRIIVSSLAIIAATAFGNEPELHAAKGRTVQGPCPPSTWIMSTLGVSGLNWRAQHFSTPGMLILSWLQGQMPHDPPRFYHLIFHVDSKANSLQSLVMRPDELCALRQKRQEAVARASCATASVRLIAGGGFEPPTSGLWARRATRLLYPAVNIFLRRTTVHGSAYSADEHVSREIIRSPYQRTAPLARGEWTISSFLVSSRRVFRSGRPCNDTMAIP